MLHFGGPAIAPSPRFYLVSQYAQLIAQVASGVSLLGLGPSSGAKPGFYFGVGQRSGTLGSKIFKGFGMDPRAQLHPPLTAPLMELGAAEMWSNLAKLNWSHILQLLMQNFLESV